MSLYFYPKYAFPTYTSTPVVVLAWWNGTGHPPSGRRPIFSPTWLENGSRCLVQQNRGTAWRKWHYWKLYTTSGHMTAGQRRNSVILLTIYIYLTKKDVANYRNSYRKITQVLETIKQTRSKHPKFLWEKQKRHNTCNSYGKNNKGTNKF